jgi:hypothetical protein
LRLRLRALLVVLAEFLVDEQEKLLIVRMLTLAQS